jgi:hypothetical protein
MNPVWTIRSQNSKLVSAFVCSNTQSAKARSSTKPDTVASQIMPTVGGFEGAASSAAYVVTVDLTADVIADATARVTAPCGHRDAYAVSRPIAAQEIA